MRVYRRLGRWYLLAIALFAMASSWLLFTAIAYVAGRRFLGFSKAQFLHVERLGSIGVEAGIFVVLGVIVYRGIAVVRWVSGRRSAGDAVAAWQAAAAVPAWIVRIAPVPVSLGVVPALTAIRHAGDPTWYSFLAICAGAAVVLALGISLNIVAIETILRPVILEIDATWPRSGLDASRHERSLRKRIVISGLCVVYISAWLATGLTAHAATPAARLALTIVGGLTLAIVFGIALAIALSQSIFGPIREIRRAAQRVGEGDLTARVPLVSSDELGDLARSFNAMTAGLAEREALRNALGAYVEPTVAERLLSEGEFLQGEEVDVTVMFVDIVGFTARSEPMHPREVVDELNIFFQLILPVVSDHGGHTNKLLGDGFMAVFGAPLVMDDHADQAVRAAWQIQELMEFRYGTGMRVGIGLNSGSVVVGTTGGHTKLDFTVIGDTVNVASRVEALTRTTGDKILITESTKTMLRAPVALAHRGMSEVRGRAEPVSIYAPVSRIPA
jgi:class 3 adenylate cyclase